MQHLKRLMLSRPYFDRVNDQASVTGDEGEKYERVLATKGRDYLMAYTYTGRSFTIQIGGVSGTEITAWWYNPRSGEATKLDTFKNEGSKLFNPPGEEVDGNDWVLVLDDASEKFSALGTKL